MALEVLYALDTARTQYYHFKAIIVAGMGLFTDAYDLFCIPPIMSLIGRIYYQDRSNWFEIPPPVVSTMVCMHSSYRPRVKWGFHLSLFMSEGFHNLQVVVPLLGTAIGQVVFGHLGDRVGRRRVYGISLMLMVLASLGCGFSICKSRTCILGSLGFFRFLLGLGIGGDYPLSATIMSEFANKMTRGAFIAAVFSMQGFGILASSVVTMIVCSAFDHASSAGPKDPTPRTADIAWRVILMLGAIPAALTCYWRMMMPETARSASFLSLSFIYEMNFESETEQRSLTTSANLLWSSSLELYKLNTGIPLWWSTMCSKQPGTWRTCWPCP